MKGENITVLSTRKLPSDNTKRK